MKKFITTFLLLGLFAFMPTMPEPAMAATVPVTIGTTVDPPPVNAPCPAGTYRVRRNSKTKKKLVNALIAGGIGAAIGGGIGGGRGALIGLGSGSGGYLVYRYVRDRRGRCVPRVIRRG